MKLPSTTGNIVIRPSRMLIFQPLDWWYVLQQQAHNNNQANNTQNALRNTQQPQKTTTKQCEPTRKTTRKQSTPTKDHHHHTTNVSNNTIVKQRPLTSHGTRWGSCHKDGTTSWSWHFATPINERGNWRAPDTKCWHRRRWTLIWNQIPSHPRPTTGALLWRRRLAPSGNWWCNRKKG